MTYTFPRDWVFELGINGWLDLTQYVEQTQPVTVEWGATAEQGQPSPMKLSARLKNPNGIFVPNNPMSPYADYLTGRNLPARWSLRTARDDGTNAAGTNRTVSNGWGTAPSGDPWAIASGLAANLSVGSGVLNQVVTTVNTINLNTLGTTKYMNGLVMGTCSCAVNDVTGANLEILNLVLRYQPSGPQAAEHYLLRIEVSPSEVLTAKIMYSGGQVVAGPVTLNGLVDAVSPKVLAAAFQVEGHSLRAAVWAPGSNAPVTWILSGHSELLNLAGYPGVRTGQATGGTNVPFTTSYDNLEFRRVGFCGELAKLSPVWDEGHRIKHADLKCAGVTQRLGRSQRPALASAFRRYAAANAEFTATDAWALDESVNDNKPGRNLVAQGAPAYLLFFAPPSAPGVVKWGQSPGGLTSVPFAPDVSAHGQVHCPVRATALTSQWMSSAAFRMTTEATVTIQWVGTNANVSGDTSVIVTVNPDGTFAVVLGLILGAPTIFTGNLNDGRALDRSWHTLAFGQFQSGGNVVTQMSVDGAAVVQDSRAGTYAPILDFSYFVDLPTTGGQGVGAVSSVVFGAARLDSGSPQLGPKLSNVTFGWPGETSVARAFRLCAEEGIPFDYVGVASNGGPMGPQKPLPLVDLLQECAEVDGPGGVLYEPRYTAGVALRPRVMVTAQGAAATLNYAGGQVAPPLIPSADDRPTVNLARADRVDGGTFLLEQTSGPMNTSQPGGADPNGIGDSPGTWDTNAQTDVQLPHVAGRMIASGTVPDQRYPRVRVDFTSLASNPDQQAAVLDLTVGDRLYTSDLSAANIYQDLDQIVRGGKEVSKNVRRHWVELNTAPYDPYRVAVYDDTGTRYGLLSTLASATVSNSPASLSVATAGAVLWTTDPSMFPFFVVVGRNGIGQVMQVSAISGASSPQTFTITSANVNGVARTWAANTEVRLYQEVRYA